MPICNACDYYVKNPCVTIKDSKHCPFMQQWHNNHDTKLSKDLPDTNE
jgi:hypothetical protein